MASLDVEAAPELAQRSDRRRTALFAEGLLTVRPPTAEAFDRFVDGFVTIEQPLLQRWGVEIAGGWRRTTGTSNQILQLYRFDSLSAIEQSAMVMMSDPEHPTLQKAFQWVERPDFRYQRQLGILASFASLRRMAEISAEEPDSPRQYVELRQRVRWGCQAEANELLRARLVGWETAGLFRQALSYDIHYGQFGELVIIGILPAGADSLPRLRETCVLEVSRRLGDLLADEELHLLSPLPYSPLR